MVRQVDSYPGQPFPPETQVSPALMLAQRIIDLFDQAGATPKERRTALDLARRIVMDEIFRG